MDELFCIILKKMNGKKQKPFIIAIDGFGCSGKTTYAERLNKFLKSIGKTTQILHIDDFIYPVEIRYNDELTLAECYYDIQFRYDYLKRKVLTPMRTGEKGFIDVQTYNKDDDNYNIEEINLSPDICILEGVFLQRPELIDYFDLKVYIDIERNLQLKRAIKRGNNGKDEAEIRKKYKEKYNPAEDRYLCTCNPKEMADFVLDPENFKIIKTSKNSKLNERDDSIR